MSSVQDDLLIPQSHRQNLFHNHTGRMLLGGPDIA